MTLQQREQSDTWLTMASRVKRQIKKASPGEADGGGGPPTQPIEPTEPAQPTEPGWSPGKRSAAG